MSTSRSATRSDQGSRFCINGRFFGQKVTGVQRYAWEITREIDRQCIGMSNLSGSIVSPVKVSSETFPHLRITRHDGRPGLIWEQLRLPRHADGTLLCFGNTGPVAYANKIVCIHDANIRLQPDSYSRAFRAYMRALTPAVVRTSRAIVTVSDYSAKMLRESGIVGDVDITVAPNGHEHALRWDPSSSQIAEQNGLQKPFVLLVGSLASHKNWSVIASVASELARHGIDIVACGAGGAEFSGISEAGYHHFKMLGRISDDDLAWLYRNAVCLAFPSTVEGFGIPLVEAMALGCPVVSSNASCMPSIVGDAAILLDPHDPGTWKAALLKLAKDEDLRRSRAEKGTVRVRAFSWEKSAATYLSLLDSIRD